MGNTRVKGLRQFTVAVGSGKGGVGKSTTAVNLAIIAAKLGRRVALIDLDPLSNLATILDVPSNGNRDLGAAGISENTDLDEVTVELYPRIDILFPRPKLNTGDSAKLLGLVFERMAPKLQSRYDLILLDMPAGISHEENLAFLPQVGTLLVVTNPEPTSHVSAGGYVRVALEVAPDLSIRFWHNKFEETGDSAFDSRDVIGNYNRLVDGDLRVPEEKIRNVSSIAAVPVDRALDLLQGSLSVEVHVLAKLLESVDMVHRAVIADIQAGGSLNRLHENVLRYYLARLKGDESPGQIEEGALAAHGGSAADQQAVRSFVRRYLEHPLSASLRKTIAALQVAAEAGADQERLFLSGLPDRRPVQRAERALRGLLTVLAGSRPSPFLRNLGGVTLCYYAILKLLSSRKVRALIASVIPRRREDGRIIRNRRLQIQSLIERNDIYHRRYFALVKTLFPVMIGQVSRLAGTLSLSVLMLRDGAGKLNKNAYLKLLTHVLHDSLHAGLGVYVGFRYSAAGRAIEDGARRLLAGLR